ncbi:hypothetical protein BC332_24702 [Capsicum chinense]|nr:hypothetical protein BC332_24702 [Capsicum chinense]
MENLVKLKFRDMSERDLDELPKEILPKLSQLQYLNLPVRVNAPVEDLASLELLEEFGGRFCDLHNFHKFMSIHHNYEKDWWYDIIVGQHYSHDYKKQRRVIIRNYTIEAATSIFLPHGIDVLDIMSCHGLSSFFVDNFLSRTTSSRGLTCEIEYCDEIEWIVNVPSGRDTTTDRHCISFHSLGVRELQNLVGLCWCSEMEEIIGREEGEGSSQSSSSSSSSTSTTAHLPKLRVLSLMFLPELKSICEGKLMCDSLEDMTFLNCPKLKRMPFHTANEHLFPSLREITVD